MPEAELRSHLTAALAVLLREPSLKIDAEHHAHAREAQGEAVRGARREGPLEERAVSDILEIRDLFKRRLELQRDLAAVDNAIESCRHHGWQQDKAVFEDRDGKWVCTSYRTCPACGLVYERVQPEPRGPLGNWNSVWNAQEGTLMQLQMFDPRLTPIATAEMLADVDLQYAIEDMRDHHVVAESGWPYVERLCDVEGTQVWAVDDASLRYVIVFEMDGLVMAPRGSGRRR